VIFVTVGSQLPFDRLVKAMDVWAGLNKEIKVVVQTGETDFIAKHCHIKNYIEPVEWEKLLQEAELVIAHAGMGTILKCIDNHKPLVILPRKWKLGEIRNDHQLATVKYFENISGICIANDTEKLFKAIKNIQSNEHTIVNSNSNSNSNSKNLEKLINELRVFSD